MNFIDLFGGSNGAIANGFEVPDVANTILLDSGLFVEQPHNTNEILLERQDADGVGYISTETSPYTQSDWCSSPIKTFDVFNYQLIHSAITDDVSSRDVDRKLRFNTYDRTDSIISALNDYSDRQLTMATNFVESKLAEALFGGVASSTYAGQKDLNFFDAFGQTKTQYEINIANSDNVNIFEQLDEISRLMGVKLLGLENSRTAMVIYATGSIARALKYHSSIAEFTKYTVAYNNPDNLITRIAPKLSEQRKWSLNGVTIIDVSGLSTYTKYIGENGAVAVPIVQGFNLFDLHTGVGVRHAELAKESASRGIHSYLTYDQRWAFPGVSTEVSILPVVNQPQSIVYISAKAE